MRYRSGGAWSAGGLTIRAPCGSVGHGGHYHSQSPEAYFTHVPGIKVVVASGPAAAKGLLLAAARDRDPVVFFEPKLLYRTAVEEVPVGDVEVALGEAAVVRVGSDVTLVGWGQQVAVLLGAVRVCVCVVWRDGWWGGGRVRVPAPHSHPPPSPLSLSLSHTHKHKADQLAAEDGISAEVIDLRTLLPWDRATVEASVSRTGRLVVSHEAPVTSGFGAEVAAAIAARCFLRLEAPPVRVCGWDTPFPGVLEAAYLPTQARVVGEVRRVVNF